LFKHKACKIVPIKHSCKTIRC